MAELYSSDDEDIYLKSDSRGNTPPEIYGIK